MSIKSRRRRRYRKVLLTQYQTKYPLQKIIYKGRHIRSKNKDLSLDVDVRNFIQPDSFAYNFAELAGAIKAPNLDIKAWLVQRMTCKFLTYVSDTNNVNYNEFWQFPFETLAIKCGDCEDGTVLMVSAMIASGIPTDRIRAYAGYVRTEDNKWGGHCYPVYIRNYDMKPVTLDWCYFPDPDVHMNKKQPLDQNKNYGDVWFSFNNMNSWGQRSTSFSNIDDLIETS